MSYKEEHMNLEQLKNLSFIFKNKLAYCHHLKDEIAILIVNAISNIDTFFYIKVIMQILNIQMNIMLLGSIKLTKLLATLIK